MTADFAGSAPRDRFRPAGVPVALVFAVFTAADACCPARPTALACASLPGAAVFAALAPAELPFTPARPAALGDASSPVTAAFVSSAPRARFRAAGSAAGFAAFPAAAVTFFATGSLAAAFFATTFFATGVFATRVAAFPAATAPFTVLALPPAPASAPAPPFLPAFADADAAPTPRDPVFADATFVEDFSAIAAIPSYFTILRTNRAGTINRYRALGNGARRSHPLCPAPGPVPPGR
ncbi:hypothetical protein ACIHFE_03675 [Streptomyces sp. NPDC052396]|uniref:hypothetical protein n=1 Tax=Streptomyces sp. NPDC052396 TaxID=3365689 RepID=UPI0037D2DF23